MPKISIIVPIYNVANYIEKCLDSLSHQTLNDIEVILVNDGSQDDSGEIARRYEKNYPNIFHYVEKTNGGLGDARNFGMLYATGEYIAFLDSDDYVDVTLYEEMYRTAKENQSDLVECDFYWVYPNKKKEDRGELYQGKREMLVKARVVAWNKLIKRDVIKKCNVRFPIGLRYEDVGFFYQLVPYINKVSFVKKPLIYYVQRENSISNNQNEKTKEIFDVLDYVVSYYKEKDIYEEYQEELEYLYTRYSLCSSLRRITHVTDKKVRKELIRFTWDNLNKKFPNWKKNLYLKMIGIKEIYMRTINKVTYSIYTKLMQLY